MELFLMALPTWRMDQSINEKVENTEGRERVNTFLPYQKTYPNQIFLDLYLFTTIFCFKCVLLFFYLIALGLALRVQSLKPVTGVVLPERLTRKCLT